MTVTLLEIGGFRRVRSECIRSALERALPRKNFEMKLFAINELRVD